MEKVYCSFKHRSYLANKNSYKKAQTNTYSKFFSILVFYKTLCPASSGNSIDVQLIYKQVEPKILLAKHQAEKSPMLKSQSEIGHKYQNKRSTALKNIVVCSMVSYNITKVHTKKSPVFEFPYTNFSMI